MFNKYTLTFQLANLEQEYRENQIPVVKKEYTTFSYQACLYMIFQSIYYQRSQPYFLAILLSCCFVVIFIIFSKFLIYKYPGVINIILPILVDYNFEIVIQIIPLIQVMTGIMVFVLAIFISLFIQGYLLLSQAFIVIGLYTFYGLIIPLKSILVYCSHPLVATTLIIMKFLIFHFGCNTQIKTKQKNNLTYFSFSFLNQ